MRTTVIMSIPEDAVPTPIELGGAAAASDALSPILDSIQWAFSAS